MASAFSVDSVKTYKLSNPMMLVCTAVPKITFVNLILAAVTGENSNAEFIGGNEQLDSQ
jgi:hypothetical protein